HSDCRSIAATEVLNHIPKGMQPCAGPWESSLPGVLPLSWSRPATRDHAAAAQAEPSWFAGRDRRPIPAAALWFATGDRSSLNPIPDSLGQSRMILLKFPVQHDLSHLLIFPLRGPHQMTHANPLAVVGGQKSGGHSNVVDIASRYLESAGH